MSHLGYSKHLKLRSLRMEKLGVTMKEINRYKILQEVQAGRLKLSAARELLNLSYRQCLRLKQKFNSFGFEGLIRKKRVKPGNLKITIGTEKAIIELRQKLYFKFNIEHFREKLMENHGISISHETLRQVLIKNGEHKSKQHKTPYRRRRRMPKEGMLVQMDTSEHKWLEHIPKLWNLIAMIDDSAGTITAAKFFASDNTFNNMHVIRRHIEDKVLKGQILTLLLIFLPG
jgi:hypothetical protein